MLILLKPEMLDALLPEFNLDWQSSATVWFVTEEMMPLNSVPKIG
jgi:hypothetical protein